MREFVLALPLLARGWLPLDVTTIFAPTKLIKGVSKPSTLPKDPRYINQTAHGVMDRILANTTLGCGDYVRVTRPDMIVVHGDRV